jgi:hypothetical protein
VELLLLGLPAPGPPRFLCRLMCRLLCLFIHFLFTSLLADSTAFFAINVDMKEMVCINITRKGTGNHQAK